MDAVWLILALGVVTYITRSSGHLIVSRFGAVHPRVQAALDAVPAAVITTIVVPPVINGGLSERIAFSIAVLVGFRLSMIPAVVAGLVVLSVLRAVLV